MDAAAVNVDVTAPGAIIALALMFLKVSCQLFCSNIIIVLFHFNAFL